MNKRKSIILIAPFLIIIFGISIINIIKKDETISNAENRNLAQRPTIEDINNKEFTTKYETYYTDQFIGRDKLLKLNTILDIKMKKSTIKDHYIVDDNWILGKTATTKKSKEDYKEESNLVNQAAKKANELNKDVYYVYLPHKVNTLDYMYPKKYIDKSYGMENSDTFLSTLDKKYIKTIDVGRYFVDNYNKEELESFYFKTDHHWNSLGAFEGFKYIADKLNIDISEYNYKTEYIKDKPFIGSYNRNLYKLYSTNEDVPFVYMDKEHNIEYYEMKDSKLEKSNTIVGLGIKDSEINYSGAYTSDYGYYKMINKDAITDKKVLVIRDSYQSPLTWMFSDIFEQVEIVDPRHVNMKIDDILKNSDCDIVMFMFNNGINVLDMMNYIS